VSDDQALEEIIGRKLSTGEIWFKALSSPKVETYQQISDQPSASIGKALYWLFLAGGFGGLIAGLIQTAYNTDLFFGMASLDISEEFSTRGIIWSFLGTIIFAIGVPLVTLINAGLVKFVARLFGGKADYGKLVYVFAAYQAPLGLLICIIGGIPVLGCLGVPMVFYWLFLGVVVTRLTCKLAVAKALICSMAPILITGILGICAVVSMLIFSVELV
jgi:hypothetical protein